MWKELSIVNFPQITQYIKLFIQKPYDIHKRHLQLKINKNILVNHTQATDN